MLNRTALTVFLYASFLYFLKRIVFVKRHVWFFRIYRLRFHCLPLRKTSNEPADG